MLVACACACEPKVPLVDIGAAFVTADATWFADEQTLFVFYDVEAQQGLSDASVIDLAFRTDDVPQDFAALSSFPQVHPHVNVSCGLHHLCGSASVRIERQPREVQLRLRYHKDGPLAVEAPLAFHVVDGGPPHTNRSAIVYGVFDESNEAVQWRLRHQFPALRNEDAERLGLRRAFQIVGASFGSLAQPLEESAPGNPYGYGFAAACPSTFTSLDWTEAGTSNRAFFDPHTLPLTASTSAGVCAAATVTDGRGTFTTTALARKNPETAPAFPALRTPIRVSTQLRVMFQTCDDVVSERHQAMQMQRLFLQASDIVCVDDFAAPGFVERLTRSLQERIDLERARGDDMVLLVGLNRRDGTDAVAARIEEALGDVVDGENDKSSPRLAGAFVYDSAPYVPSLASVQRQVLWCPSAGPALGDDLEEIDPTASRSCAVQLDPERQLGPVRIASLPILPTRRQYERFVDRFSEGLAGSMTSLTFRAPLRTPLSENVPLDGFGEATFFNNEAITADADDSFSFCGSDDAFNVVFRIAAPEVGPVAPLALLPDVHAATAAPRYALGLAWDFPFLLQLEYESFLGGAATVAGFTIPFGLASPSETALGSAVWLRDDVDLRSVLLRCERFCTHPTFDSAGVYNVLVPFDPAFRNQCYAPLFPTRADGGFPRDP
jgi:hypothetical protein